MKDFGQQSVTQRNKLYQDLTTKTTCYHDKFIIDFSLFMKFVDNKKKRISPFLTLNNQNKHS